MPLWLCLIATIHRVKHTDRQTDYLVQTVETWPNREEEKNIRSHKLRQSPGDLSGNCELLIYTWYNLLNYDLHNYLWKATRYQLPALHRHHRLRVLPQLQQFVFYELSLAEKLPVIQVFYTAVNNYL